MATHKLSRSHASLNQLTFRQLVSRRLTFRQLTRSRLRFGQLTLGRLAFGLILASVLVAFGCGGEVKVTGGSEGTGGSGATGGGGSGGDGGFTQQTSSRVDLLFVIDNSRSMADKQQILSLAVTDLLRMLVNPLCIDPDGTPTAQQPTSPTESCPVGAAREFQPIFDMHVGVISSSLGGHGADSCSGVQSPSENDNGYLINRSSTDGSTPPVPTWQNSGFLVWDPANPPTHTPQGLTDVNELVGGIATMVNGAGEIGCGFESTLEAWYRFLVDPNPYESIQLQGVSAVLVGTDQALLQQRRDFLRPDSLLTVIMLSDENDCSIRDGGQFYFAGQIYAPGTNQPYHLPRPRAACAIDPNDFCCRSCGQPPGDGCDTAQDNCNTPLTNGEDHVNVRCFDQKRRFGIDFLQPLDRYVAGLTEANVADRDGNVVKNPLFSDLDPTDSITTIRNASLVRLAAIVGVPWQDIARRNANGQPDLLAGLNNDGLPVGGLQSATELAQNGAWALIAGDLVSFTPPSDPYMVESLVPRAGTNPITGDTIQPPGAGELASPINGHEFSNPLNSELQYSCIFPLTTPRDCGPGSVEVACDCDDPNNDSPLCVANPNDNGNLTLQKYAKAYPGLRQLNVLKALDSRAAVGSVCPAQTTNTSLFDFGYRPAATAILDTMRPALQ